MNDDIPLTDGDRWDWLIALCNAGTKQLQSSGAVIVTCSSLRRRYRDVFRVVSYHDPRVRVRFIYLWNVDEEQLRGRLTARVGHYMKESMVRSQMECLEEPEQDEVDVTKVDVRRDQEVVCGDALAQVRASLSEY